VLAVLRSRRFVWFALAILVTAVVGEVVLTIRNSDRSGALVAGSVFIEPGKRRTVNLPASPLLQGGTFDPASTRGKVTVLNLWASWCTPCTEEAPVFKDLSEQLTDVAFVGIDAQESAPEPGRHFIEEHGLAFPNLYDGDARAQLALGKAVPVSSLPVTVVLDRSGRVAGVYGGLVQHSKLNELITTIRAEQ
jgi:cytochrome c biogenesis protein CcmG/thiol:disulfide interchange protein DsbE